MQNALTHLMLKPFLIITKENYEIRAIFCRVIANKQFQSKSSKVAIFQYNNSELICKNTVNSYIKIAT